MHPSAKRILVADDREELADITAAMLRLEGHEVMAVYGGSQAVAAAREFHPDCVVLDIDMPDMNGYEAAALLRDGRDEKGRPMLVAYTGMWGPRDEMLALEAGFDHHVAKPSHDFNRRLESFFEEADAAQGAGA